MKILQLCAAGISAPALTKELEDLGHMVLKADCDPPGEDFLKVPPGDLTEDFIFRIEEIVTECCCLEESLAVLPHNQDEVRALSLDSFFEGRGWKKGKGFQAWRAMVPAPVSFFNTNNKLQMNEILQKGGLPAQEMSEVRRGDLFGVLIKSAFYKPNEGCGSKFAFFGGDIPGRFVVSKKLEGQEYTIDCLCQSGQVIDWCVRKRIKAHGGICIDAEVLGRDERFKEPLEKFAYIFGLNGPYAIQCFFETSHREEIGDKIYFTDCNCRFGGGVGLSLLANWKGVENWCLIMEGKEVIRDYEIKKIRVRRSYREEIV